MCWQPLSLKDPDRYFFCCLGSFVDCNSSIFVLAMEYGGFFYCSVNISGRIHCSQELLKAVGRERALRRNKIQAAQIYHRSPVEEYEFDRVSPFYWIFTWPVRKAHDYFL